MDIDTLRLEYELKKQIAKSYSRLVSFGQRPDLEHDALLAMRASESARVRYQRAKRKAEPGRKNDEKYEAYLRRQRNVARRKLTRGRVEK